MIATGACLKPGYRLKKRAVSAAPIGQPGHTFRTIHQAHTPATQRANTTKHCQASGESPNHGVVSE